MKVENGRVYDGVDLAGQYRTEINQTALLTRAEEVRLGPPLEQRRFLEFVTQQAQQVYKDPTTVDLVVVMYEKHLVSNWGLLPSLIRWTGIEEAASVSAILTSEAFQRTVHGVLGKDLLQAVAADQGWKDLNQTRQAVANFSVALQLLPGQIVSMVNSKDPSQLPTITQVREVALESEPLLGEHFVDIKLRGGLARQQLIEANLRLVAKMARQLPFKGMPLADLIQEGNIGLITAVDKYDWRRGHKLSTYATWSIRRSMASAIADQAQAYAVSDRMFERITRWRGVMGALPPQLGREPTEEEVAEAMGISLKKLQEVRDITGNAIYLGTPVGTKGDHCVGDYIRDSRPGPADIAEISWLRKWMEAALKECDGRSSRIFLLCAGITGKTFTHEQAGQMVNPPLSRTRVGEINTEVKHDLAVKASEADLRVYL